MSVTLASAGSSSFQPFQCGICQTRFTRHENLKRHAALHSRSPEDASFPCDFCQTTFSRRDLRHRHMKRKHPDGEDRRDTKRVRRGPTASTGRKVHNGASLSTSPDEDQYLTQSQHSRDDGSLDMDSATWHIDMPHTQQQPNNSGQGPSGETTYFSTSAPTSANTDDIYFDMDRATRPPLTSEWSYEANNGQNIRTVNRDVQLQGPSHTSIRQPGSQMLPPITSQTTSPSSILNSSSLNQHIPEGLSPSDLPYLQENWLPSATQTAQGVRLYFDYVSPFFPFLHQSTFDAAQSPHILVLSMLSLAYQYGEDPDCNEDPGTGASLSQHCFHSARVLLACDEESSPDASYKLTSVQSYLLLQICAMMYLCGKDSKYGLRMHSKLVTLARSGGLMQPIPVESAATKDLESLWYTFIKAESHKRTLLAVHQIDALWYHLLSIPRSLSHLEIKHDLPCTEECWIAPSSAQWAHQQLVGKRSASSVQYVDAVRHFLSPDQKLDDLPAFDPYGAINITQFLLSSAREMSGWATMTGRLSLERFEPLRSSLVALEPFIRPQDQADKTTHAATCEATWEMAMVELKMWSPTHTGGVVEGSMDAVLQQSTYLASTCEFLYETETAKAIQPHIDWFLRYLDATKTPDREPPWLAVYAYKAFLLLWQIVRKGFPGAMQVVGVLDGDLEGAMAWARSVFERRLHWQLGKLIMSCLDQLDK